LAAVASIPPRYSVLGSAGLSTATTAPLWRALLWTRPPPNSSSARISSSVPRAGASALLLPGLPSAPTKCLSLLLQQQHNDNQRVKCGDGKVRNVICRKICLLKMLQIHLAVCGVKQIRMPVMLGPCSISKLHLAACTCVFFRLLGSNICEL
ncbi:Os11g0233400, partial [Oryza sativa Japonica Group]